MPHILKNKDIELLIDLPQETYELPRFDWTGKIREVKFQNIYLSSVERIDLIDDKTHGKGFYNEFGIDAPIGFEEISIGEWFPKIGVGLLKKDKEQYDFMNMYEVQPAEFEVKIQANQITIICRSQLSNGYSYLLEKKIELLADGFQINYFLKNTGSKTIETNEYNHNFMAIDQELMGSDYTLTFPFELKPGKLGEVVNPEQAVSIGTNEITFTKTPKDQFFYSYLSGGEMVDASWELINHKTGIGIKETGNFQTNKINLWGWEHVISPELFFKIFLESGQSTTWKRRYKIFRVK